MIATYHNHTIWSDGRAAVGEMVERAAALGVDEVGFSDHFVLNPRRDPPSWSMPPPELATYVQDVLGAAGAGGRGPAVRLGLEVDWFPGQAQAITAALRGIPFDFLIGSVHEVDGFPIDSSSAHWDALDEAERNQRHRRYWQEARHLAESGLFDIAAHLDLSKKFGHRPTIDLSADIAAALDAIASAGIVVELNTAGWHRPCGDAYPSLDILRQCRARDIPVTLSSDAHEPDHLLRDFRRGRERLRAAGYGQVARFAGRTVTFDDLDTAVP